MTQDAPGGSAMTRVLADDYLADLATLALEQIRERRAAAEELEADVSYVRRLVQGRVDIVRAELERRRMGGEGSLLADLPQILSEGTRSAPHGLGRHAAAEPSNAAAHRQHVASLVPGVDLTDVGARTDDELRSALSALDAEEVRLSAQRRALHAVLDRCNAEIARRYRDGEADVTDLLAAPPGG